ncbi:hypothetical protein ACIQPP_39745 [Streptomyces violaceusniger]|uniref:hypothetical protein n=1 Tax=Streptomyces violaceusniger TaxID=68280 RepID=UPI0009966A40|nr:hypothetical protein [Streptomyces hygroscopicus]
MQAAIVNLLLTLTTRRPLGLVVVSHDLAVISHLSDTIVVMERGRIVEAGPTEQVLFRPEHPYTRPWCPRTPGSHRTRHPVRTRPANRDPHAGTDRCEAVNRTEPIAAMARPVPTVLGCDHVR